MASVVLIKVISIVVDVINENKDEWFMVIASFTNSGERSSMAGWSK